MPDPDVQAADGGASGSWIVVEPTLGEWIGHQRGLVEALPDLVRRRGRAVRVFASTAAPAELVARHGVVPLFPLRPLPNWATADEAKELARFLQSSHEIADALAGPGGPSIGTGDLVLLPTAYPWVMLAVASWLRRMPQARRPLVAALVHEGHGLFVPSGYPATVDQAAIVLAVSALASVLPAHRLLVAATSEELADALGRRLARDVGVVPVANPVDRLDPQYPAASRRTPCGAVRVIFPGIPRIGKNAGTLPATIAAVRAAAPDTWILAQVSAQRASFTDDPMVDLRSGALQDDDYCASLTNAAIAVLPYDPAHYRGRVSGIFVEAAAAGCIMVVPAGTWMADQVTRGCAAGLVAPDPSPVAIAATVARACAGLSGLSSMAFARAPRWREAYGPGPFVARIEGLMAGLAAGAPTGPA